MDREGTPPMTNDVNRPKWLSKIDYRLPKPKEVVRSGRSNYFLKYIRTELI